MTWILVGDRHANRTPATAKAFTLMELLLAITIISLLMAVTLPALAAARATARQIQCASNLRQLGLGSQVYATEFSDVVLPAYYDSRLWQDILFNGPEPLSNRGVLPDPYENANLTYRDQTWIHHCTANPYRVNRWRDPSYTVNYALTGWSSDPAHELSSQGSPGPRWLRLGSLPALSQTIQLADAAVAGLSGNPPDSNFGPTHLLAWRDQAGFDWHRGQANWLILDGHVKRLSEQAAQQQLARDSLFWRRQHADWW